MFAILLAATLAAAPAARPTAPKGADLVFVVGNPRTDLPQLRAFLAQAGGYAPSLRPVPLGNAFGGLLGAELFDAQALEEAGVDLGAPLTLSFQPEGRLTCFSTAGDKAAARMKATLAGAGQVAGEKHQGAALTGATVGKAWRSGFVTKGKQACIASGAPDVLPLLKTSVAVMGRGGIGAERRWADATGGLSAPVIGYFDAGGTLGGLELLPGAEGLKARGVVISRQLRLATPQDGDPLAALKPAAALVATATLARESLTDPAGPAGGAVRFLLRQACPACDREAAKAFLDALGPSLFGSMSLLVPRVDPSAAGGPLTQYYLFPHTYLLSLSDSAGAAKALGGLVESLRRNGVQVSDEQNLGEGPHHSIELGGRRVYVGLTGKALYLSNERAARDLALVALKEVAPARAEHSLQATLDGPLATAAIRKVTILDVPKSPELAAIFAVGVEAGSLLKAAGPIGAFADPDGRKTRFELDLVLPKPTPAPEVPVR